MGWITGGVTTLAEQTQDVTVLQEVTESGNAIVYSRLLEEVMALDGSTVVVSTTDPIPDVLEVPASATFLVEQAIPASTITEVTP
jgi:hypothetical protein